MFILCETLRLSFLLVKKVLSSVCHFWRPWNVQIRCYSLFEYDKAQLKLMVEKTDLLWNENHKIRLEPQKNMPLCNYIYENSTLNILHLIICLCCGNPFLRVKASCGLLKPTTTSTTTTISQQKLKMSDKTILTISMDIVAGGAVAARWNSLEHKAPVIETERNTDRQFRKFRCAKELRFFS